MDDVLLVRVAKALGDPTRFAIFKAIAAAGQITCGEIATRFPVAQPTVSHHLKVLADAGLVEVRREGSHGLYSVEPTALARFADALAALPAPTSA
jgi:ArsR family transcriptional regulator